MIVSRKRKVARLLCERCGHAWKRHVLELAGGDCPRCAQDARNRGSEPPRGTGIVKRLQTR